jgi:hypothetical protein
MAGELETLLPGGDPTSAQPSGPRVQPVGPLAPAAWGSVLAEREQRASTEAF